MYFDGIVLKRSWAGEARNLSLLVAIGFNGEWGPGGPCSPLEPEPCSPLGPGAGSGFLKANKIADSKRQSPDAD